MRISAGGVTGVEGLEGPKAVLSVSPLEATATLATGCLNNLQLAVERMYLGRDVEDAGIGLVVASDLSGQPPVVGAADQVHGLMVGRQLPGDGVDEPHGERLGRSVAYVRGGGE